MTAQLNIFYYLLSKLITHDLLLTCSINAGLLIIKLELYTEIVVKTLHNLYYQQRFIYADPEPLKHGIVVLRSPYSKEANSEIKLGNRALTFSKAKAEEELNKHKKLKKSFELLENSRLRLIKNGVLVTNTKRREEVFAPFQLGEEVGYLHIWTTPSFKGFASTKYFVTAGCIYGSGLQGVIRTATSEEGNSIPIEIQEAIINHNLHLNAEQEIIAIEGVSDFSPYEIALFAQFRKICALIDSTTDKESSKILYHHLPFWDYILFIINYYINGQITIIALNDFIYKLFLHQEKQKIELDKIASEYGITVIFSSPFNNIFTDCEPNLVGILTRLKIVLGMTEKELVNKCLDLLVQNDGDQQQQYIWRKHLGNPFRKEAIISVHELLRIGNALMLSFPTAQQTDCTIVAIHPITEKQIQLSHTSLNERSSIVYVLILDPVISQIPLDKSREAHEGLIFYLPKVKLLSCQKVIPYYLKLASENLRSTAKNSPQESEISSVRRAQTYNFFAPPPEPEEYNSITPRPLD